MRVVILTVVLAAVLSVEAKQSNRTQRALCSTESDGTFLADDTSCSNFYVCYEGAAVTQSCGEGSYFNTTSLNCLPDTNQICRQTCSEDGAFSPNPTNCNLFYVCYEGQLVEQDCGAGSYFNSTELYCQPDTDNICTQSQCSEDGVFSPHPTNCSLFYVCYAGQLVEQDCGPGSYFNSTNLYCEPDTECKCPQAECSVNGTFSPHPSDCTLFYVCYDGKLVEQNCGVGSYFNKTELHCLPDDDNICWPVATTPAPCTCAGGYTEGDFVANPDSCYSYYVCTQGNLMEQDCGYGNYFDDTSKSCERDSDGKCWITTDPPTTTASSPCNCPGGYIEGDLVGNSDSCSSYFICTQGELVAQSCGTGNYFDSSSKTCVRDDNGICWPTTTPAAPAPCLCPGGYEEGDLVGNSDSCSSYFICTQGELVAQSCGAGNYFESSSKTCVRDDSGICWPTTTPAAPAPCLCPGGYEEGDLIGNSDSCSSYFICTQGELVAQSCGTGNYFDSSSKTCVRDDNGICWPTTTPAAPAPRLCPGGYEEGDLIGNSDSCSTYFICTQGELVAQSCGTGNYFDSSSKTCVRDDNGICWPTTTTPAPCTCEGGYEDGEFIPYPGSCYLFYICYNGELIEQSCGEGNYFDDEFKRCVLDTTGKCWPVSTSSSTSSSSTSSSSSSTSSVTGSPTPSSSTSTGSTTTPAPGTCEGGYEDGEFIPYPGSCYLFYICYNGELIEQSCDEGNYFDDESKTCVLDTTGKCWSVPTSSSTSSSSSSTSSTTGSPTPSSSTPTGSTTTPAPGSTSSSSSSTSSVTGSPTPSSSTSTGSTTTPAPGTCEGGYEDGEFIPYPGSCYLFYICYNGEFIEKSCDEGNYFDDESKSCVLDTTGKCWPVPTSSSTSSSSSSSSSTSSSSTSTSSTTSSPTPTSSTSTSSTTSSPTPTSSTSTSSTTTPSTTTPSTTTPAPCTCEGGYEDGEFIPYPGSCYLFYICYNGELIEKSCDEGNYFDDESKSCVLDTTGKCWPVPTSSSTSSSSSSSSSTSSSSTSTSSTTSSPTPTSSTSTSSTTSSPTPTSSTSTSSTTTPSTTTPSTTTPAPCTCEGGYEDGEFIPYPGSCYLFYICYNGELIEKSCDEGNYFDDESKSCVLDTTGKCWPVPTSSSTSSSSSSSSSTTSSSTSTSSTTSSPTPTSSTSTSSTSTSSTTTPSTTTPSTTTPAPCTCEGGYEDGELIPHLGSCYLFYICYNGELIEESCGEGNYFDDESKTCVLDTTGKCWPVPTSSSTSSSSTSSSSTSTSSTSSPTPTSSSSTSSTTISPEPTSSTSTSSITTPSTTTPAPCTCEGGYEDGELIPHPGSCYLFYICYNGELIEESCGEGNYFDDESKTCVLDTTGKCWPVPTSSSTSSSSTSSSSTSSSSTSTSSTSTSSTTSSPTPTSSTSTSSTTTPSTTTPGPCTCEGGYEDGDFVPYPDSCYLFYICYNGELIEQSCGEGNYFDDEFKRCVLDTTGKCWPVSTSSSTSSSSSSSSSTSSSSTTSSSTSSSSTSSSSTSSSSTPTSTTLVPCTCAGGYEDGDFVPYPGNCYLFYLCYQGELIEQSCGYGNYFDAESKACFEDTTGKCWPLPSSSTSTTSSTSIAPTAPAPCKCAGGYESGDFIPHPESCYLFYVCYEGELSEMSCGVGNYFNNDTKSCSLDTTGICWPKPDSSSTSTSTAPTCTCPNGYQEGELIASPSSCSLFYICTGGELVEGYCGTGNYFNNDTKACEPDTGGCCWPDKPPSPPEPAPCECPNGLQEGQFIENPSSCSSYYVCTGGELVEGNCGTGNYFNNDTKACEPDTGGCCWPDKPPSPPEPAPCECPNGLQEGQFIENPSSCSSYYICTGGELVEGNCGTGNYFNNENRICEPDTGGCCWPKPTECPGGYANGEFIPIPEKCDQFYICNDGVLEEQECGVGYYFDANNKYCSRDVNGTCWTVEIANDTCEGVADGTYLRNPASCDKFFVCLNNTKIPQECGVGNLFNSANLTCTHDTLGVCWKKIPNVCANTITGTFVQNPSNCQEFYVCHQNRAVLQQCGNGNWFNPSLMACQPDLKATCINVCQATRATSLLPHPNCNQFFLCEDGLTKGVGTCPINANYDATLGICLTSTICEANLCYKSTNGAVFPVQNDLTSFYSCYNQIPVKLSCPDGTSFDAERLICTPDTGRCIGQKNGFVVASYDNPNAYYVCRNNMAIFEQCPSYAVFDEKKRLCVPAQRKRLANNICSAEADGAMLPGDTCNKFHLCLDGEKIDQNCGAYSSFNQKLGYCVFNLSCFNQDEICAKSSDIEKFPDARFENSFVKCKRGLAVFEKCPNNMIYSHDIGYCVPREMAMTEDELDELCSNMSDNTMAPALDCRKFYICRNSIAVLQQCAIDQHFDVKTGMCLPDVERHCWIRSETLRRSFYLKTVCHEGHIRAYASNCTQFEICMFGIWMREECPDGYFFDLKNKVCTPGDADGMCPTARSAVVECSHDMPYRQSDELCTDYYRCENNQWKATKCPDGEFFSIETATCTKDISACTRSIEMQSTKKNPCTANETRASDVNCEIYHICYEEDWWYRYCQEGTYFNKTLEACIPNDGTCQLISKTGSCKNGTATKSDFDPCIAYHLCVDGNWTLQRCPTDHHFNESRKACMLDDEDWVCQYDLKNASSTCVEGSRRFQRLNCTSYDICSFDKWLSIQCRPGFYFDAALEECTVNSGECSADGLLRRNCIDNTSRPSPSNCRDFYYCSRNEWHTETCLESFQYNVTIDKCIATNNTCVVEDLSFPMQHKCFGHKSGSYLSHETDCTKYYLCVDDQSVDAQCSYGKFFDNESKRCQLNDGACPLKIVTDGNICHGKTNGSHLQNPANCTTFYICSENVAQLSYCSEQHYFNADIGVCQADTGICNRPRLCNDNPEGNLPHETYCNVYYACVRGMALPVACEEDEIFDSITRKCTPDTELRCVDGLLVGDAICSNVENGKLLVDSDDCTNYIICSNRLGYTLQCPPGQFFDSSLLTCMPDDGSCRHVNNSSTTPPDPISCVGKHGDIMPDPEHCNEFYMCIYGSLRHEKCFEGEFFDNRIHSCTPMVSNEKCPTDAEMSTLCITSEDGTNFADQTDCRKYYQCTDAELLSKKCRTGESFDTLLGFCRQNDGTCLLENGHRVGACAAKHGKLTADADNCRGYFTCINGQKISEKCENGEYFDKVTSACEKDVNNTCRPVGDEFTNTTQLSCIGLIELVFYPNILDDCRTFYQCVKGMPRVHKCPDDLLFNAESGNCDWKDYVKCMNDGLCVNVNNGARFQNTKDNCDSYFICDNGKLKNFKCDQGLKYNVQMEKCDLAANVNCTMTVQN